MLVHGQSTTPDSPIKTALAPLQALIDDKRIQNLNVSPNLVITKGELGRQTHQVEFSAERIRRLATLVANHTDQRISDDQPRLAARLPGGHRVQFSLPPLMTEPRLSIRCLRPNKYSLSDLGQRGLFNKTKITRRKRERAKSVIVEIEQAVEDGNALALLEACVANRRSILVAGAPFSGKTTLVNALIDYIDEAETIFTIEDARELRTERFLDRWDYEISATAKGKVAVSRRDALADALRVCTDRILLGEIRFDDEASAFVTASNTGIDGCMGTIHASSAREAEDRLAEMLSRFAGDLSRAEALEQVRSFVDVFVMVVNKNGERYVSEITFA